MIEMNNNHEMSKVLIVVNAEIQEGGKIIPSSPVTEKMVVALKKAIDLNYFQVEIIAAASLWSNSGKFEQENLIYCPLTIQLPPNFKFPAQDIYHACKDIKGVRNWVETNLGYKTSIGENWLGDLWLPVIWTNKGPVYAEVIGEGAIPNSYQQPVNLGDDQRQNLYHLAYDLLEHLSVVPSVYLLQFRFHGKEIIFDRVWPFPAAPAIATIGRQQPDLFVCHWHCLISEPILDVKIKGMN